MLKRNTTLYLVFLSLILILLLALQRLYLHLHTSLGSNIFVVIVTVVVMVLLGLFLLGLVFSGAIEKGIQKHVAKLSRHSPINRWLINFLEVLGSTSVDEKNKQVMKDEDLEMIEAMQMPKKRGRTSNHAYKKRRQAVLEWERRGTNYHFTLFEFLDERFGTSATGIPNVPIPTFYDWRKEILEEINSLSSEETKN